MSLYNINFIRWQWLNDWVLYTQFSYCIKGFIISRHVSLPIWHISLGSVRLRQSTLSEDKHENKTKQQQSKIQNQPLMPNYEGLWFW